jgi:glycosyltransferase involved in cell wall biosynthesis
MRLENKQIAFWGTPPPPIGGMTVHIDRLSKKLVQSGFNCTMYNFTSTKRTDSNIVNISSPFIWYLSLLFGKSPKIHYVITTRTLIRFLAVLFGRIRNKKILLRVGGKSLENDIKRNKYYYWMSKWAIRNCTHFIGVNKNICATAESLGKEETKISHIPGFIKPIDNGELPIKEILDFFEGSNLKLVLSGQVFAKNEFDIYGLWDVLEALEIVKRKIPEVKLVIFNYTINRDDSEAYESYLSNIKMKNLSSSILIIRTQMKLWTTLKFADIFLRPSYTDGDANSLREALSLNVFSIASDVVPRPEGAVLYSSGDIQALANSIIDFHQNSDSKKDTIQTIIGDAFEKTKLLIESFL